ncbi:MAG: hypothetical protein PHQ32_03010 [Firmicutes bacterium]|nr:hypothetical protein [Bacillota bacterium]
MVKVILLIVKKEIIETISNKRKLWPFIFAILPIFMFFYTKGSDSMFDIGSGVYILPIFITTIIAMQLSSTSILNEKSTKMLDIILGMKINAVMLVIAKNTFSTIFSMLIGLIIILTMKFGSIYAFREDILIINFGYLFLFLTITYFSSVLTFLISLIIRELSVIPIVSTLALILFTGTIYKLLILIDIYIFSNTILFSLAIFFIIINIVMTFIDAYCLTRSQFLISI